jgi:hypothetical protein
LKANSDNPTTWLFSGSTHIKMRFKEYMVVSNVDYYYNTQRATLIVVPRDEEYNYWSPVLWIELGRALIKVRIASSSSS